MTKLFLILSLTLVFVGSFATAFLPDRLSFGIRPFIVNDIIIQMKMTYVPSGMSKEQCEKLKAKEAEEMKKKKFGAYGPQSFKSRSLQSFQKDLEAGKAGHLMPVFNAKEKLQKGLIKKEDIPYMQRMGSWDNSDVGKKTKWSNDDKKYNANAKENTVDWSGTKQQFTGPKATTTTTNKKQQAVEKPKIMFGLF